VTASEDKRRRPTTQLFCPGWAGGLQADRKLRTDSSVPVTQRFENCVKITRNWSPTLSGWLPMSTDILIFQASKLPSILQIARLMPDELNSSFSVTLTLPI
jgi:hypothetical protein